MKKVSESPQWYWCESTNGDNTQSPPFDITNTEFFMICIFLLANILLLIPALQYFRKVFLWLQQKGQQANNLYKASGVVLALVNCAAFISDIVLIINHSDFVFFLGFIPLKVLIVILEVPVVCFNTHDGHNPQPKWKRLAHTFASCHILWFMHRVLTDVMISVVFFIIAPAQTLGIVTLFLSTIACGVIFLAQMLNRNYTSCSMKTFSSLFCVFISGVFTVGLILVITLTFIVFVDNGLQSSGMGGFILSLIPPITVLVIGFYVNRGTVDSIFKTNNVRSSAAQENTNNQNQHLQDLADCGEPELETTSPTVN